MTFDYRTITAAQLKAARALLEWDQDKLEQESGVSTKTIQRIEKGDKVMDRTLRNVCEAMEKAGIQFLNDDAPGVRLHADRQKDE